jgi:hypothetical protein
MAVSPAGRPAAPLLGVESKRRTLIAGRRRVRALLGFEHEAAALVEVDVVRRARCERNNAVDGVGVSLGRARRWLRWLDTEDGREVGEEESVVGALARAGCAPLLDERVDSQGCGGEAVRRIPLVRISAIPRWHASSAICMPDCRR